MPANWIEKMNTSNSRKHKESTIAQAVANSNLGDISAKTFLVGAWYAYNPFNTYNLKRVPETTGYTGKENPWDDFFRLLVSLANRDVTGNAAIEKVEAMSERFDSDQWNDFARGVILKDLRVGATLKTFNKFLPKDNKIPVFECQLATDSTKHEKKMVGDKFLQVKLDGVRVITIVDKYGNVEIFSRNGKKFENFGHIAEQVSTIAGPLCHTLQSNKVVLDGEIMSDNFQALMKQANRKHDADASDSVYHIFDIVNYGGFANGRSIVQQHVRQSTLDGLKSTIETNPNLKVESYLRVNLSLAEGHNQMKRYAEKAVADGYEGIMIKDASAPYQCKRSTSWLKWKPVITVDLEVIDLEEGTGRNVGRLGALVCEGIDNGKNIKVNVGSGLTDSDRDEFWNSRTSVVGQIVEVKADAVTQNQDGTYSLRFPRFERFRSFDDGEKI